MSKGIKVMYVDQADTDRGPTTVVIEKESDGNKLPCKGVVS